MANYRKIYEQYYGVKIPKGYHIHHKDFIHSNDDPLNLEMLTPDEHAQKHGFISNFIMAHATAEERAAATLRKPEIRAKMKLAMMNSPSHKEFILKRSENKEWKAKVTEHARSMAKNRTNPPWNKGKVGVQVTSKETKALFTKQRLGRMWFTNGIITRFLHPNTVPTGFRRGRI